MKRTPKKLIQLKQKDIPLIRKQQWLEQNKECPILKRKIKLVDAVLDHKHKKKNKELGENLNGLCRGVIHKQANSFEGIILNKYIRQGLHKFIPISALLRNIADYLDNPPMKDCYIHPSERPVGKKLKKRSFNTLKQAFLKKYPKKTIEYPKSKKLTKKLEKLFNEFNITPEYYKKK